jgi:uncharacterized protein (TIGR02231 family)
MAISEVESPKEMAGEPMDQIGVSPTALGFSQLRMQGPQSGRRGQLKAVSRLEYLSDLIAALPAGSSVPPAFLPQDLIVPTQNDVLALRELALPDQAVGLEQSAAHFAARYPKEGLASIDSDGRFHALSLLRRSEPIRRIYRCVPRFDTSVYQFAEFNNPLGLPLLAGPVRVYMGGNFVVSALLDTTEPGKAMSINLGVEPGIGVARNVEFHESVSGLMGGQSDLEHRIVIEVNNKLGSTVNLEVFERIPVSCDDHVNIEIVEANPQVEVYDQARRGHLVHGGRVFRLKLDPGEVKTCSLAYRISIPSKQVLEGGNRRD